MKKEICERVSQLLDVPLESITEPIFQIIVHVETPLQLHKYFRRYRAHVPLEKTTILFQLIKQYKTRYVFIDDKRHSTKQKACFIPLASEKIMNEDLLVLGNCIQCGKIALLDDDPNQCNFCSSPIMKLGNFLDQSFYDENGKQKSSQSSDKVCPTKSTSLREACCKLDQLLEYQSSWSSHSHVYDDAVDWFRESNNMWLSKEQKDQMLLKAQTGEDLKQRRKTNNRKYVTIDLQNQQVFESSSQDKTYIETSDHFLHRITLKNNTEALEDTLESKMEGIGETNMSRTTLPAPLNKSCQEMYNYLHSNMLTNKNIPAILKEKN